MLLTTAARDHLLNGPCPSWPSLTLSAPNIIAVEALFDVLEHGSTDEVSRPSGSLEQVSSISTL